MNYFTYMHAETVGDLFHFQMLISVGVPIGAALLGAGIGFFGNAILDQHKRSREHRLAVQDTGLKLIELCKQTNRWNLERAHSAKVAARTRELARNSHRFGVPPGPTERRNVEIAQRDETVLRQRSETYRRLEEQVKEQSRLLRFLAPQLDAPREALVKRATGNCPAENPAGREWVEEYNQEEGNFYSHLREYVDLSRPTRHYLRWARKHG